MLGGSDTRNIPGRSPERHHFPRCRVAGCRGFGLVTLLAGDTGYDFRPMACCGDPRRCADKVVHPPELWP